MKKPYVVLHIGMPKSGTTAIQRALNEYLDDPSFAYLRVGGADDCNHLFSLFCTHPERYFLHKRMGTDPAQLLAFNQSLEQELLEQLERYRDKNCILSGESFVSLSESELLKFRALLNRYFADILIVAYVRAPRSNMESGFQQSVKSTDLPDELAKNPFKYRKNFERFDRVFGKDNVRLWKFDSASLLNGDVVEDFCHRLGIKIAANRIDVRNNEALSAPALKLLYTYRTFYPYGKGKAAVAANGRMIKALKEIKGKKVRFSPKVIGPLLDQQREDIAWIEERIGASLSENMVAEEGDIESIADLLAIDDATIDKLKLLFGDEVPPGIAYNLPPKQVADILHALSLTLARGPNTEAADEEFLKSLVQRAVRSAPERLGNMSEARAVALLKAVFSDIAQQVNATTEDVLIIPVLGRFRVRQVEKEKGGKKVAGKKFIFVPAKNRK